MKNITNFKELEKNINYTFKDKQKLTVALCHSSYVNENTDKKMQDNETFEFLGDAVLNLIVGHILMDKYPILKEGDLSRMRANLVCETQLAAIARTIDLGKYIQLGKGEIQTNGREKNSILSDTLEALIAGIYLDAGFDAAFSFTDDNFSILLDPGHTPSFQDPKSLLQEYSQIKYKKMPTYKVVDELGPDHNKTFKVKLEIETLVSVGIGKSKKAAEQDAAKNALESLEIG